jgi:hypothetical protein
MTEKVKKTSDGNTKVHKINVIVTTDKEWESDDVADTIKELLEMDNDVEDPSFTEIGAASDPTNDGTDMQEAIEETLELLSLYCSYLRMRLDEHKGLELFNTGMTMIEHGVTDLKACVRCAQTFANKIEIPSNVKAVKVGLDDLNDAPKEIVHAVAHMMGLEPGECELMSKEDMVDWIKDNVRGEPRTIN